MGTRLERRSVGDLLRGWRQRRRCSQLDLALRSEVSARHLSFVETGRSRPSRELVLRLAEELEVPLVERNVLLTAAGHAPAFRETPFEAPEMARVREAVERVVRGHEPYPAYVTDRLWNLVTGNPAAALLLEGAARHLLEPPVNAMRLGLHPEGLASRIVNFEEYSGHHLARLRRQVEATGDPELAALYQEVRRYPRVRAVPPSLATGTGASDIVVALRLRSDRGELCLFNTVATFGTAVDITLDDLVIELLFPADDATRAALIARGGAA